MPRRARLSLAGIPWHIIQRGNNRSVCFFAEEDYRHYLDDIELNPVRAAMVNRPQDTSMQDLFNPSIGLPIIDLKS
jgi:REP element-mobilizing transposase RayT